MSSHPTSFPVSLLYRLNPTGFMLRRSSIVKSKLLRFSADDKITGMLTNPKLTAPFHNGRGMIRPSLYANQGYDSRLMHVRQNGEYRTTRTSIPHSSQEPIMFSPVRSHPTSRHSGLLHYLAIIGTNFHGGLLDVSKLIFFQFIFSIPLMWGLVNCAQRSGLPLLWLR